MTLLVVSSALYASLDYITFVEGKTLNVIGSIQNSYNSATHTHMGQVQVTPGVTLRNVIPLNNLLHNSYFENPNVELHVPYVLNIHANFHVDWILFTI